MAYLPVPKGAQIDILLGIPSRTIRTLRSHFRKHKEDLQMADRLWNDYHTDVRMQNGPVKALRQALLRLHCIIKPDMHATDTWGRTLHICQCYPGVRSVIQ